MKKPLTHWIASGGEYGCLPDNCDAYPNKKGAVDSMIALYELSRRQATELRQTGIVNLRRDQGGEMCKVSDCNCHEPWIHSDDGDKYNWDDYSPLEPQETIA